MRWTPVLLLYWCDKPGSAHGSSIGRRGAAPLRYCWLLPSLPGILRQRLMLIPVTQNVSPTYRKLQRYSNIKFNNVKHIKIIKSNFHRHCVSCPPIFQPSHGLNTKCRPRLESCRKWQTPWGNSCDRGLNHHQHVAGNDSLFHLIGNPPHQKKWIARYIASNINRKPYRKPPTSRFFHNPDAPCM